MNEQIKRITVTIKKIRNCMYNGQFGEYFELADQLAKYCPQSEKYLNCLQFILQRGEFR